MTTGPPMSSAIERASSFVLAKPNLVTGMPARLTISRASYSKKRMGGAGAYKEARRPSVTRGLRFRGAAGDESVMNLRRSLAIALVVVLSLTAVATAAKPKSGSYKGKTDQNRTVRFKLSKGKIRGFQAGVMTFCTAGGESSFETDAIANLPAFKLAKSGKFSYSRTKKGEKVKVTGKISGGKAKGTVSLRRPHSTYDSSMGMVMFGACTATGSSPRRRARRSPFGSEELEPGGGGLRERVSLGVIAQRREAVADAHERRALGAQERAAPRGRREEGGAAAADAEVREGEGPTPALDADVRAAVVEGGLGSRRRRDRRPRARSHLRSAAGRRPRRASARPKSSAVDVQRAVWASTATQPAPATRTAPASCTSTTFFPVPSRDVVTSLASPGAAA